MVTSVVQDVRFGLRTLAKRPLFTTVSVLTLGLGIGTTTAMYSVVDGVLLRSLPFEEPGELVSMWREHAVSEGDDVLWNRDLTSYPEYLRLREGRTHFRNVALYGHENMFLTGLGEPERISVGVASASLFWLLGVRPLLGRGFLPGEDGQGADRIAVLSHSMWRTRFGGHRDALGAVISLDDQPYSVVGVLPPDFRLRYLLLPDYLGSDAMTEQALWVPIGHNGTGLTRGDHNYETLMRVDPGVSLEQVVSELQMLHAGDASASETRVMVARRKAAENAAVRAPLLLLLGAASVLLLIACSNAASLFASEATDRIAELTTRAALGASSVRVIRLLLVESMLLGFVGSAIGILFAIGATRVLVAIAPTVSRIQDVRVSGGVLLFASGIGILTSLFFGVVPAVRSARDATWAALNNRTRYVTRTVSRFHRSTVSLQIALTIVLLVAGGLLSRSLLNLTAVDPGFDPTNLATVRVSLPESRYPTAQDIQTFYNTVHDNIETIPGVRNASGTFGLPFAGVGRAMNTFRIEDRQLSSNRPNRGDERRTTVLPGFHEVLGIPLLVGRTFNRSDGAGAPRVMVVSESMARKYWDNESVLGSRVRFRGDAYTVVGIVGDVRHAGLDSETEPIYYVPQAQAPERAMSLVVRTTGDPGQIIPRLREAVWSVDHDAPITQADIVTALIARSSREERYRTLLVVAFAVSATVLSAVGVLGTTARGVTQRTRELGIRMALGAREAGLIGATLRDSLVTSLAGTAFGLVGAFAASRLLSRFLFGVEPSDALTYGVAAALVVVVCLAASYVPARRIASLNPVDVLRAE